MRSEKDLAKEKLTLEDKSVKVGRERKKDVSEAP